MGTALVDMAVGEPPSPLSKTFDSWCRSYRNEIMNEISLIERTDYYFSYSEGDDANDGLSESSPKKTVGEMNTVLAGGNNRRVLLKKGDTWTTATQINLALSGNAIGTYGTGDKPILQMNSDLVPTSETWTLYSGGTYVTDSTYTITTSGRVIYENDRHTPLKKASSAAAADAEDNSYYYDTLTKKLYVRTDGTSPAGTAFRIFPTASGTSTDNGIYMTADYTWVDGVETWGFGLSGINSNNSQIYHIKVNTVGTDLAVISNCDGYLFRSHCLAANNHGGGIFHIENCKTGWAEYNSGSGATHINAYNDTSGTLQFSAFWNNMDYGVIPDQGGYSRNTVMIYGHGAGTGTFFSLLLAYGNSVTDGQYGGYRISSYPWQDGHMPGTSSSLSGRRDFIVNETWSNSSSYPIQKYPVKNVRVNCSYDIVCQESDAVDPQNVSPGGGFWHINCHYKYTTTQASPGTFGLWHNPGLIENKTHIYGSYYYPYHSNSATLLRINRKADDTGAGQGEHYVEKCVFVNDTVTTAQLGLHNDPTRIHDIACYGIQKTTTPSHRGYDNITNAIDLTAFWEDTYPTSSDQVYQAGGDYDTPDGNLEYDAALQERNATACSIGRYEPQTPASGGIRTRTRQRNRDRTRTR